MKMLGTFLYLTNSQLCRLGLAKSRGNFTRLVLNRLKESKLIDAVEFQGREYENILYLTEKGARSIAEYTSTDISKIKYPQSKPNRSTAPYFHRKYEIDCHIEAYLSCLKHDIKFVFFDHEIEKIGSTRNGNNLSKKTRVDTKGGYLEPDSIFMLDTEKGNKLYTLELERRDNRSHYQLDEKIRKHAWALNMKSVSAKHHHSKAHRNLFVCENENTKDYIISYIKDYLKDAEFWFLFKLLSEVKPPFKGSPKMLFADNPEYWKNKGEDKSAEYQFDFFENWETISGERVSMY